MVTLKDFIHRLKRCSIDFIYIRFHPERKSKTSYHFGYSKSIELPKIRLQPSEKKKRHRKKRQDTTLKNIKAEQELDTLKFILAQNNQKHS